VSTQAEDTALAEAIGQQVMARLNEPGHVAEGGSAGADGSYSFIISCHVPQDGPTLMPLQGDREVLVTLRAVPSGPPSKCPACQRIVLAGAKTAEVQAVHRALLSIAYHTGGKVPTAHVALKDDYVYAPGEHAFGQEGQR